jgi:hypothetical protein
MQIISADRIGIALIHEPYLYQNRLLGITKGYITFTSGIGKSRAAIVISNNTIYALLITQLSENDAILLEIVIGLHDSLQQVFIWTTVNQQKITLRL